MNQTPPLSTNILIPQQASSIGDTSQVLSPNPITFASFYIPQYLVINIPRDIMVLFFQYLPPKDCISFASANKQIQHILKAAPGLKDVREKIDLYYSHHIQQLLNMYIWNKQELPQKILDGFRAISPKITSLHLSALDCTKHIRPPSASFIERFKNMFLHAYSPSNAAQSNILYFITHTFQHITQLNLDYATGIGKSFNNLLTLSSLTHLNLKRNSDILSSDLKQLATLPQLQYLDLSGSLLSHEQYSALQSLKNIKELHLYNDTISDNVWRKWIFWHPLRFRGDGSITRNTLQSISHLPIKSALIAPDVPLSDLCKLNLVSLGLEARSFKKEDFQLLSSFTHLESLTLSFGDTLPTTEDLQFLCKLPNLHSLILYSASKLPKLPPCSTIKNIVLAFNVASHEVLESLTEMRSLQTLYLFRNRPFDLAYFKNFTPPLMLESLFLNCTALYCSSITETEYMKAFATLKHLGIHARSQQRTAPWSNVPPFLLKPTALKTAALYLTGDKEQLEQLETSHLQHLFIEYDIPDKNPEKVLRIIARNSFMQSLTTLGIPLKSQACPALIPTTPKKLVVVCTKSQEEKWSHKARTQFQLQRKTEGQEVIIIPRIVTWNRAVASKMVELFYEE